MSYIARTFETTRGDVGANNYPPLHLHDIVSVVAVTEQVLTPEERHDRRFGQGRVQFTQAFPWVFVVVNKNCGSSLV
jgi:hypothetical protein